MGMFDSIILRGASKAVREEDKENLIPIEEFEKMLKQGIMKFTYIKKDGFTVRTAYGTKNMSMPDVKSANGGVCPPKEVGYTTYYDYQSEGWRVFHNAFLLRVESDGPMSYEQMEREMAEDIRTNRAAKDALETKELKAMPFKDRPFYWKKQFIYPDNWEILKNKKKKKSEAAGQPEDAQ